MRKLLVICGPTATGKTKLALSLAKKLAFVPKNSGPVGELISADSRQVYLGMDIGTGKDLPKNSKFKIQNSKLGGYYKVNSIKIWGYDLVEPTEEFSVAQYVKVVREIIKDIWERGKLPILVGGTGLYVQGVVDGIDTSIIPKNEELRKSLEGKSSDELFELLTKTDPVRAASLNVSDKRNPRRLVRAIEIANSKTQKGKSKIQKAEMNILFVGLKANKQALDKLIEDRVEKRIKKGFKKEFKGLLENGLLWSMQSMSSLGYQQYKDYAFGRTSKDVAISNWKKAEKQYAKRQITWFKRDKRINWFDITEDGWQKNVEKLVNKWYK